MLIDQIKEKASKMRERASNKRRKIKPWKMLYRQLTTIQQVQVHQAIEGLKSSERYANELCLIRASRKLYSQHEEDGMIHEIFTRIGTTNKIFVEFGIGDGLENNSLALLVSGWSGLWMEGSSQSVNIIREHFQEVLATGQLKLLEAFINCENINQLISSQINETEIDLLSVDIDGNDIHIFNAITVINPRVVVIEYNAKFFPPIKFSVNYDPANIWQVDDYMGVSLQYLEDDFSVKGYSLVGCDLAGVNAFFVRNDLLGDKFLSPYTAEKHYEPARYHLGSAVSGHAATHRSVANVLSACAKNHSDDR